MDAREWNTRSSRMATLIKLMYGYKCMLKVTSKLHVHSKLTKFKILIMLNKAQTFGLQGTIALKTHPLTTINLEIEVRVVVNYLNKACQTLYIVEYEHKYGHCPQDLIKDKISTMCTVLNTS